MFKHIFIFFLFVTTLSAQSRILINMDLKQADHLKAYGITFNAIENGNKADWLLNYRGGSFLLEYTETLVSLCRLKGVSFEILNSSQVIDIYTFVQSEDQNMEIVRLEKSPKIAVYVTPGHQPWDDAVTMALEYAEVPYTKIWIEEILRGDLNKYDWLHLHHEDFTGQYGKFYGSYANQQWYIDQQLMYEKMASKLGFKKVSKMELAVVKTIKDYIGNGGFLFAMCSATDSYDIALAAENVDICERMYDGDAADTDAQKKLDFSNTLAFTDFKLEMNPLKYEYSDIDIQLQEIGNENNDYFTLFEFSAKYDPVPTMLTQNHLNVIRGFMGQTTMFRERTLKKSVIVMGKRADLDQVRYIHGKFGRGFFTFYGGHDPEDYKHLVEDRPTDLNLYKNSAGYRLILNNILFPAAKKKKQKT